VIKAGEMGPSGAVKARISTEWESTCRFKSPPEAIHFSNLVSSPVEKYPSNKSFKEVEMTTDPRLVSKCTSSGSIFAKITFGTGKMRLFHVKLLLIAWKLSRFLCYFYAVKKTLAGKSLGTLLTYRVLRLGNNSVVF
jgi:hypothetical protein